MGATRKRFMKVSMYASGSSQSARSTTAPSVVTVTWFAATFSTVRAGSPMIE